jgi:Fic family protein
MLFQAPPLTDRELAVLEEIERIRLGLDLPTLKHWLGLPWRAINARLLRLSADGNGAEKFFDDVSDVDSNDEDADVWSSAAGYRNALSFALNLADAAHFVYDEGIFRALHYMITGHDPEQKPGRWRRSSIWVKKFPSAEILYTAPAPKLIPALMAELIASLNERSETPAIVRAAMAHLNLAAIHPFADGNGRMSRAVHTLVMARAGMTAPPFASIDEYLSVKTDEYDRVLREVHGGSWQPERDPRPWIHFCLTAHLYQATALQRRSREYDRLWEALGREIARHGAPERATLALAEAAMGRMVAVDDYESAASVSADDARGDLRALVDAGLFVESAQNGASVYVASDSVKDLWTRTREPVDVNAEPFATSGG